MGTVEPLIRLDPTLEARIRDYVAGRLDAHACEAFELAMLEDPDLALAVAAEQGLRDGLREMPRPQPVIALAPVPEVVTAGSLRKRLRRRWLPLAASGVGLAVGFAAGRFSDPGPVDFSQHGDTVWLDVMRGAPEPEATLVRIAPDQRWLLLMLPRPDDDGDRYEATLRDADGRSVAADAALRPQQYGGLLWPLNVEALRPGRYRLDIRRAGGGELELALMVERGPAD